MSYGQQLLINIKYFIFLNFNWNMLNYYKININNEGKYCANNLNNYYGEKLRVTIF